MNFRVFEIPTGSGETLVSVENATNVEQIWDVSDITNAKKIVNKASGAQFFRIHYNSSPYFNNEFVAFKNSASLSHLLLKNRQSRLIWFEKCDYLIVTTKDFTHKPKELPIITEPKNYQVEVADVKKIYNEFSSGGQDLTHLEILLPN